MKALLVIRTPFQAWLAQKVLEKEQINIFDVVYFTQNDSEEDRHYYSQLSKNSNRSDYIFVRPQRFDILSHFVFRLKAHKWYQKENYDFVMYGSINALVPNSLISKHKYAKLITFDDGAANIVNNGIFYSDLSSNRSKIYRLAIGAVSLNTIKRRISYHYTMYKDYGNIVEKEKLRYIDYFEKSKYKKSETTKTYFIASPFEEVMSQEQIKRLEIYSKDLKIDFYVTHPRERNILNLGTEILDKKGKIAEEAIIADAQDASIVLVGWFSSVMLNIGPLCKECIVLLPKDSIQTPKIFELSKNSGLTPVLI